MNSLIDPKKKEEARRQLLNPEFNRNKPAPEPPHLKKEERQDTTPYLPQPNQNPPAASAPVLNPNSKNQLNEQLSKAVLDEDLQQVMNLLSQGADVNSTDDSGWSVLHTASCRRNPQLAELLVRRGANVNLAANNDYTPLMAALDAETAKILIRAGARLGHIYNGMNALELAKAKMDHLKIMKDREGIRKLKELITFLKKEMGAGAWSS